MKQKDIAVVSGSHGFIGSHLMDKLEKEGMTVIPIPRGVLYDPRLLSTFYPQTKPTYIFHLAAYGNMAEQTSADQIFLANLWMGYQMLRESNQIPYKAFVNVSSSAVLLPHKTMYSATKAGMEYLVEAYASEYEKPAINVRPYSVYGRGEADFRFIPTVFRSCIQKEPMHLSQDAVHDWIYVDDLIDRMVVLAKKAHETPGTTYDIGTGVEYSNMDVVRLIEKITGHPATIEGFKNLRSFDQKHWRCETPLKRFTSLEEGLRKIYPFYKKRYE